MQTTTKLSEKTIGPSFHWREYAIDELVGGGCFGHVYRVRQREGPYTSPQLMDQPLALKVYHYSHASFRRPVLSEIVNMMSIFSSPCSVQFFDRSPVGETPEYIVMEYIPETIEQRCLTSGEHLLQELLQLYFTQMPLVLGALQDKDIVHCDLQRANIGIKDERLKVLDFGLATSSGIKSPGVIPKKRVFYPPEAQEGIVTPALDMYCAGKVLEYILAGSFAGEASETIGTIEYVHDLTLPVSWKRMFSSMLDPDYQKRPTPEVICHLMADALQDTEHLHFSALVPLNKADLFPSSSSLFG